ncbi:MAG: hypothetical protein AUJ98_03225 [Bacteroidetes bacterium CG2_30_33_31]|nr:MAG: hypothetical protein AUJ98_03225 [Bacteroidetes bacterium CG2_30_33_31]
MVKQKVALVLSSGGARGLAQIGVIEELEKRGYQISSISGTSIGSVVGGAYAAGGLASYKDWMLSLTKKEVFNLMDFTIRNLGFMKGKKVFDEMQKRIPNINIEDLPIPFVALSTNLETNKEVVFDKGNLYEALRASISIPTLFVPYLHNSHHLVDGGLLNPIPVNHVKRNEDDILVAVNLNAHESNFQLKKIENKMLEDISDWNYFNIYKKFARGFPKSQGENLSYINILNRSLGIMLNRICELELKLNQPDILIDISRNTSSTFEFYRAKEIINAGTKAAIFALDNYENKIAKK